MKVSVEAIFPKGKKGNGEGRREVEAVGERRGDAEMGRDPGSTFSIPFSSSPRLPISPSPLLFVSLLGQAPAEALLFIIHQSSFIILWCALV